MNQNHLSRYCSLAFVWILIFLPPFSHAEEDDYMTTLVSEKNPEEAEHHAKEVIKTDEPFRGWMVLSYLALIEQDGKKAIKMAECAIEADPEVAEGYTMLGNACGMRIGQVNVFRKMSVAKKMLKAYEKAYELDPNNEDAVIGLYYYYRQAPSMVGGDKEKAKAFIEKMWTIAPSKAASILASEALEIEHFSEAYDLLKKAYGMDPNDRAIQYKLGKTAALSGQNLEEGKQLFEDYLKEPVEPDAPYPGHDGALWRLGQIYAQMGNEEVATKCFQRALDMPSDIHNIIQKELNALNED